MRGHFGGTNGVADILAIGEHFRIIRVDADVEMPFGEEFADRFGDQLLVHGFDIQIKTLIQAPPCARTVHGSSVEIRKTVIFGQNLGRRGFAHACRAINGYTNHSPTALERERTSV